jgi:hypothetical protein
MIIKGLLSQIGAYNGNPENYAMKFDLLDDFKWLKPTIDDFECAFTYHPHKIIRWIIETKQKCARQLKVDYMITFGAIPGEKISENEIEYSTAEYASRAGQTHILDWLVRRGNLNTKKVIYSPKLLRRIY